MMLHALPASTASVPDPERFTYPFCYTPHPLCRAAAATLRTYLEGQPQWHDELSRGKMMGVLVVRHGAQRGFLAAFSGTLGGQTRQDYFVPPVFDLMQPGGHFQQEQDCISVIGRRLIALQQAGSDMRHQLGLDALHRQMAHQLQAMREEADQAKQRRQALRQMLTPDELAVREAELRRESQYQKAELRCATARWQARLLEAEAPVRALQEEEERLASERKRRSEALQEWLFAQYSLLSATGERRTVGEIFGHDTPPSGTGDCCAPKLLQAAYAQGMRPLCMAEFWVGRSPADEVRTDGHFYPACHSRCRPLLGHMLRGLRVDDNPLMRDYQSILARFGVVYADECLAVVHKPEGMLAVPGKEGLPSVQDLLHKEFPWATGPIIVHRLDMDTSGLMVAALTPEAHRHLQQQFLKREVSKTYVAVLQGALPVGQEGDINLPLCPDLNDRPRQRVDYQRGRPARTHYQVVACDGGHARVLLHPITGRTHQLRVHCAHPAGLNCPIVGDRLYGQPDTRLMLHAQDIAFTHPKSGKRMEFHWQCI